MLLSPKDLPQATAVGKDSRPPLTTTLTEKELELIDKVYDRSRMLAEEAANKGTRIMIDTEQVKFAPAIDNLATTLQQEFNATDKSDYPIIYNTYQCYLKNASDRLRRDVERSERLQFHFGTKLCRGAYLEQEL